MLASRDRDGHHEKAVLYSLDQSGSVAEIRASFIASRSPTISTQSPTRPVQTHSACRRTKKFRQSITTTLATKMRPSKEPLAKLQYAKTGAKPLNLWLYPETSSKPAARGEFCVTG